MLRRRAGFFAGSASYRPSASRVELCASEPHVSATRELRWLLARFLPTRA